MTSHRERCIAALVAGAMGLGGAMAWADEAVAPTDAAAPAEPSAPADPPAQTMTVTQVGLVGSYEDGRFSIASDDGHFSFSPRLLLQMRYAWSYRDGGVGGVSSQSRSRDGTEITRLRVGADGHVFTPELTYNVLFASGPPFAIGSAMRVLDAYVTWAVEEPWSVRAGQFRDPLFREFDIGAGQQLAVARSLADNLIGGSSIGRVQGAAVIYDDGGPWRGIVALHQGTGSANSAFSAPRGGLGPSGRVEYMFAGDDWRAYRTFRARDDQELTIVGGGAALSRFTNADLLHHTIDVQWNNPADIAGLAVFAALLGRYDELDGASNQYHFALVGQGGYRLDERWDVFGRYSLVNMDSDLSLPADTVHELTIGGNYYFAGEHGKVTADLNWLPRGSAAAHPAKNILAQSSSDDQLVLRVQLQLMH
ncbi:MAG: hypothetical protein WD009_08905 [Phycisphaeraceae bacterium]